MKQDHLPDSAPAVPDAVKDLAAALGAGLSIWGAVNLLEGYETDDPALKDYGLSLVMRGSVIAALGASGFGCPPELLSGIALTFPDLRKILRPSRLFSREGRERRKTKWIISRNSSHNG